MMIVISDDGKITVSTSVDKTANAAILYNQLQSYSGILLDKLSNKIQDLKLESLNDINLAINGLAMEELAVLEPKQ
jgi:hypothetical protein